jgi:hypothetical protein
MAGMFAATRGQAPASHSLEPGHVISEISPLQEYFPKCRTSSPEVSITRFKTCERITHNSYTQDHLGEAE